MVLTYWTLFQAIRRFNIRELQKAGLLTLKMIHDDLLPHGIKGIVLFDEPMRNHTTFKIGGPADILVIPRDLEDIKNCIRYAKERAISLTVIGNGSKILVSDKGIRGIVIKLSGTINHTKVSSDRIIAGAGCSVSELLGVAIQYRLSGLEFAAGIPGTLGGAIAMNASTSLGSVGDIVSNVTAIDVEDNALTALLKKDCIFTYRGSIFQHVPMIVVEAEIRLTPNDMGEIEQRVKEFLTKRKEAQPLDQPSAGSIFRNPPALIAGKLIESAGLKGARMGNAQISEKHANFIVNLGNARAQDVHDLMRLVQRTVKARYGLDLVPELRIVGDW